MLDQPDHGAVDAVLATAPGGGRSLGIKATISPRAECVQALATRGWTPTHALVCDQFGWGVTGLSHPLGGPVNPLAPHGLPGGSSSGCAVAVSTNLVDTAIGTDTGGSIRIPAAWCGVVGYRPSTGRVSSDGIVPLSPTFDTPGLMTRTVAELLEAAGAWGIEPWMVGRELRIGVVRSSLPMSTTARTAHRAVLARLSRAGVLAGEIDVDTRTLRRTFSTIQMAESVRSLQAEDPARFLPAVRAQHDAATAVTAAAEADAVERRADLAFPGDVDLLVLPTVGVEPPPRHDHGTVLTDQGLVPVARTLVEPNVLAPLLGAPAVTVPVASGRPLGVQLVGRPGADELLLGWLPHLAALLAPPLEI